MDGLLMERITDVSTHICAGSVSTLITGKEPYKLRVSIHICAGNVSGCYYVSICCAVVSTHICAGNVSSSLRITPYIVPRFNSYMRGECFCYGPKFYRAVLMFRFIYVRGMFSCGHGDMTGLDGWGFNSYICGECFRFPGFSVWCHRRFNLYMCGECFGATKLFWRCYGRRFQLIYVRGMFHVSNAACPSGLSFQLIYVRGMFRGLLMSYPVAFWRFNLYMHGECFGPMLVVGKTRSGFQFIYVRGMFQTARST